MIQLWQRMFWKCFIRNAKFSLFFRGITLAMKEKNTTFANEKSVLLIDAEHCRIEKLAGFLIVTCQVDNICKFLVFNG